MIDLSQEYHPVPKPLSKVKMPKPMKQAGKKTKEWNDAREILKAAFYKAGIINCEIQTVGCWKNNTLGFAHKAKRRNLSKEDLYEVVLACNNCHDKIEWLTPAEMGETIDLIIKTRKVQPKL